MVSFQIRQIIFQKIKKKKKENDEDELTSQLQYLLLGYLRRNAVTDPSLLVSSSTIYDDKLERSLSCVTFEPYARV